jgi:hypothetical protein
MADPAYLPNSIALISDEGETKKQTGDVGEGMRLYAAMPAVLFRAVDCDGTFCLCPLGAFDHVVVSNGHHCRIERA